MPGLLNQAKKVKWMGWGLIGLLLIGLIFWYRLGSTQESYRAIIDSPPPPPRLVSDKPAIAMQSIGYICYYKDWDKVTGQNDAFNFNQFTNTISANWSYWISWKRNSAGRFEFSWKPIVLGISSNVAEHNAHVLNRMSRVGFNDNAEFTATLTINYVQRLLRINLLSFTPLSPKMSVVINTPAGPKTFYKAQCLPLRENLRKIIPYVSTGTLNLEVSANWDQYTIKSFCF